MLLFNELPLSLPWHNNVYLQDRFRPNTGYNKNNAPVNIQHPQLAPYDGLLPFQVKKNATGELPVSWEIRCATPGKTLQDYIGGFTDGVVADMSAHITLLEPFGIYEFDYLIFKDASNSANPLTTALPGGLTQGDYYMAMQFSDGLWCSEIFRVPYDRFGWNTPNTCNYPMLQWHHGSDIAPIKYTGTTGFYNKVYLDTSITASEPTLLKEIEEDGNVEPIATFLKAQIKHRLSIICPDYMKVALFMMQMHDFVTLTTELGLRSGPLKNFEINSTLTEDGALSIVEIVFEQVQLITQTNCEEEMAPPLCAPIVYAGTVVTAEWRTPDATVYLKMSSWPAGTYGELWGSHSMTMVLINSYVSKAEILAGFTRYTGHTIGYFDFVVLYVKSFGCGVLGSTTNIVPVPTY